MFGFTFKFKICLNAFSIFVLLMTHAIAITKTDRKIQTDKRSRKTQNEQIEIRIKSFAYSDNWRWQLFKVGQARMKKNPTPNFWNFFHKFKWIFKCSLYFRANNLPSFLQNWYSLKLRLEKICWIVEYKFVCYWIL
jgi:hypothetical protein